ncbi:hypothetical protein [Bathymodiolus japonicus methanotrophic gill symbiont]|uniref:hypothetical protein n=1 Tax=Bathymodiolus japonicus methanotrophic gill symbiont TaxID=113269 RepID=UPI001C8DEBFA|nr:hypothetical protein [Bathymodiolus japonicus methanotrophic gill symbiont]
MRSRCGRRAFRASPIRCVGERIMATGVPEFREVAWRACFSKNRINASTSCFRSAKKSLNSLINYPTRLFLTSSTFSLSLEKPLL